MLEREAPASSLSWLNSAPWKIFSVLRQGSEMTMKGRKKKKKMAAAGKHLSQQCLLPSLNLLTGCFSTLTVDVAIMTRGRNEPCPLMGKLFQIIEWVTSRLAPWLTTKSLFTGSVYPLPTAAVYVFSFIIVTVCYSFPVKPARRCRA